MIQLSSFETDNSRLFFSKADFQQISQIIKASSHGLGVNFREREFWTSVSKNDLILFLCIDRNIVVAARIRDKTVKVEGNPVSIHDQNRLIVLLDICGIGKIDRLDPQVLFELRSPETPAPHAMFKILWERCLSVVSSRLAEDPCMKIDEFVIKFAISSEDAEFIRDMSSDHPFGMVSARLALIAFRNDVRVGALLADFSEDSSRLHTAAWSVFRGEYPTIRKSSIFVSRLYDDPAAVRKFKIQTALLKALELVAPAFFAEPVSILEGVSYDFNLAAFRWGACVETPASPDESFYYWKPIKIEPAKYRDSYNLDRVLPDTHSIIRQRKEPRFWIAPGWSRDIQIARAANVWAVSQRRITASHWRLLKQDHVIFLMNEYNQLVYYGAVLNTKVDRIPGYEQFPLRIDFKRVSDPFEIDMNPHTGERWFRRIERGGLVPLPREFGVRMKDRADNGTTEGRMWVEPNPYILHHSTFRPKPYQVFVIQSWQLAETVYPMVKEILQKNGYSATYAGDRNGQVVFDDIWLMLNESAAVIVDFTDRRPNVYLEFGMALVLGKPIIAITQNRDDLPPIPQT